MYFESSYMYLYYIVSVLIILIFTLFAALFDWSYLSGKFNNRCRDVDVVSLRCILGDIAAKSASPDRVFCLNDVFDSFYSFFDKNDDVELKFDVGCGVVDHFSGDPAELGYVLSGIVHHVSRLSHGYSPLVVKIGVVSVGDECIRVRFDVVSNGFYLSEWVSRAPVSIANGDVGLCLDGGMEVGLYFERNISLPEIDYLRAAEHCCKILCVDSDSIRARQLSGKLQSLGLSVFDVSNPLGVFSVLMRSNNDPFDFLLIRNNMKFMSWLELAGRIRDLEGLSYSPKIILLLDGGGFKSYEYSDSSVVDYTILDGDSVSEVLGAMVNLVEDRGLNAF